MYQYEDLYLKICDNFHNEINQVLFEIEPSIKENYWFERKSIQGKFYIIKDILLSLNGIDIAQYQLINLQNILKKYKPILENWFSSHNIATGFYYLNPEDVSKTRYYFSQFDEYACRSFALNNGYLFMIDIEMIGFSNDCHLKLSARIVNGEIVIEEQLDPIFSIEEEKGKRIGNTQRTRHIQQEIEYKIQSERPDLCEKGITNARTGFKNFAQKTHTKITSLLTDFDKCNDLCNSLIDSKMNDTTPANLPELEKIYSVLKGTYLKESFEKFLLVFNTSYSGEKLTWLKSGPQLKYFIDQLNGKLKISDEINKWAGIRFEMNPTVKDLSVYLRKQTTKGEYQLLNQGNLKKDPLYKLFREQ